MEYTDGIFFNQFFGVGSEPDHDEHLQHVD